ncbi:AbiH family protein [Chryseobacterium sp. 3008163]|uniref:AbiH family protein n=1 Tax=Chryseobacterium sp. 3008163 TaxID=2478663 RepID=UPI000F0D17F0|nr:AbiH family protein [Chryseobacterium sp. 3008163]AYN01644.1 hypothetical protein EAG08_16255 [Chryseobacterium sp. 3008163]
MEEKIVILGNGFDLRHFLPTSYNHLISILCEIEKLPEAKKSISFSDLFDGVFKEKNEWFYNQINEYYQTENFIFDLEEIKSIQNRLGENSWFQYFKSVDENKIETWIDFETEIERILLSVLEYFESFNKSEFKKPRYAGLNGNPVFFVPIALEKEFFKNKLQISLLKFFGLFHEDGHNLNVFEKFILNIGNEIQYYKERDFLNFIYISLENFVGIFNDYIISVINVFYKNLRREKMENFTVKDDHFIFEKTNQVFSFNYTSTLVNFYSSKVKARQLEGIIGSQYQPIHGLAKNDWGSNLENLTIVLGVDDINNSLKKHKLFQFTKYFQKLHKRTDYLFLDSYKEKIRKYDGRRITFYFWGHSLDYSDRQYIKEIFDLVSTINGCKIKIFYHSISAKGDQLKNLLGIIEKEKIEKFMKDKTIEFIESTSENLFKEL